MLACVEPGLNLKFCRTHANQPVQQATKNAITISQKLLLKAECYRSGRLLTLSLKRGTAVIARHAKIENSFLKVEHCADETAQQAEALPPSQKT